jgi:hypothetical protein
MLDLLLIEWVTKMKPGSNSVEDHPQLSHSRHPVDGALVGAGSLWPENEELKTGNNVSCKGDYRRKFCHDNHP